MSHIVVLDFETYYDEKYSLSNMTVQQYITDTRFQVIGVGVSINGREAQWIHTSSDILGCMDMLRKSQDNITMINHNAMFDSAILSWMYDVHPNLIIDTWALARSCGISVGVGGSLKALAKQLQTVVPGVPSKGDEVVKALGKRYADFTREQLAAYGEYCKADVEITAKLASYLCKITPPTEALWQHIVHTMYTEPRLHIDKRVVEAELQRVQTKRENAHERLNAALGINTAQDHAAIQSIINSNHKFAEMLELYGATVPMKVSKKTGKKAYALSLQDAEFVEMLDHPTPEVAALVAARTGLKSSNEEARCHTFLWLADNKHVLPIPMKVSGARTHRLGGGEEEEAAAGVGASRSSSTKMGRWNPQNLPSGRIKNQSKALRSAIVAPEGFVLVSADSSQIEVRIIDTASNNVPSLEAFREGLCAYSVLAVALFGEGTPEQIKRDAKAGVAPWDMRRQIAKSARLALQFGQGAAGFQRYAKTQAGITITLEEAEQYKLGFRRANPAIVNLWKTCDRVLALMVEGRTGRFGGSDGNLFVYDGNRRVMGMRIPGIQLPDGMWLSYPELAVADGTYGPSFTFCETVGRRKVTEYTYGAKIAQGLTQAVAFAVMKWYATQIEYPIVLNAHDEHVLLVPKDKVRQAAAELEALMCTAPPWLPGAPLECEVHIGHNYGELK